MSDFEDFAANHTGAQRDALTYLHAFMLSFPGIKMRMRYGLPFYDGRTWIAYLNPLKEGCVAFCFVRAHELSNEQGALNFRERAQVADITFCDVADCEAKALLLTELVHEAILLDREVPQRKKPR